MKEENFDLFPDKDAERIVRELGMDFSGEKICRKQCMWMNSLIRQYNLAWEIEHYLENHPKAAVVELGLVLPSSPDGEPYKPVVLPRP